MAACFCSATQLIAAGLVAGFTCTLALAKKKIGAAMAGANAPPTGVAYLLLRLLPVAGAYAPRMECLT